MVVLLAIGILVIALLGAPLFIVIGATSMLSYSTVEGVEQTWPSLVYFWYYKLAASPLFVAIPLFALAGTLLGESRSPKRIVALARAMLGWLPGGLAVVAVVACAWFTAFTGASGVTIIALGGLLFPILLREKYPEEFSLGLLTTCGSLGLLFPPSLAIIVYGLISEVNPDVLFKAGLLPGIFLMLVLGGYSIVIGYRSAAPRHPFSGAELWKAFRAALWELPIPVLVIGGIYGGFYTAAEASGVAAAYVLFVECVVYREIGWRDLPRVLHRTSVLVGAILVIMGMAIAFAEYLTDQEVPQTILEAMKRYITSPLTFLIALNIFLIIVGCMMDIFSAILVVVPLISPIAEHFGVDPVHLGIIFLTNLEIGYSTPPVGINLFLASLRFERPVITLYRVSLPFLGLLVLCLIVVTYVPFLSLALPAAGDVAHLESMTFINEDFDEFEPEDFAAKPGEEIILVIEMKNAERERVEKTEDGEEKTVEGARGEMAWTRAYRLIAVEDTGPVLAKMREPHLEEGAPPADELWLAMGSKVTGGATATFEVTMTAPEEVGSHRFVLQMEHAGMWMFGERVEVVVKVAEED